MCSAFYGIKHIKGSGKGFEDFTYEQKLNIALNQRGYLIVIDGVSSIDKTALCKAVVGTEKLVAMTGNDFTNMSDFWSVVAKKVDISLCAEVTNKGDVYEKVSEIKYASHCKTNKERMLHYFLENQKVLLLDDFHYVNEEILQDAAYQLKEVIRYNFKVIIITNPHKVDEIVKNNPDLQGRIMNITITL